MLHGGKVSNNLLDLLSLARAGPKTAILTLKYGFKEIAVSYIDGCACYIIS